MFDCPFTLDEQKRKNYHPAHSGRLKQQADITGIVTAIKTNAVGLAPELNQAGRSITAPVTGKTTTS